MVKQVVDASFAREPWRAYLHQQAMAADNMHEPQAPPPIAAMPPPPHMPYAILREQPVADRPVEGRLVIHNEAPYNQVPLQQQHNFLQQDF